MLGRADIMPVRAMPILAHPWLQACPLGGRAYSALHGRAARSISTSNLEVVTAKSRATHCATPAWVREKKENNAI